MNQEAHLSLLEYTSLVTTLGLFIFILSWLYFKSIKYVLSEEYLILYVFYLPLRHVKYESIKSIYKVNGLDRLRFFFFNYNLGNFSRSHLGPLST